MEIPMLTDVEESDLRTLEKYSTNPDSFICDYARVYYHTALQNGVERDASALVTAYQLAVKLWDDNYDNRVCTRRWFNYVTAQVLTAEEFVDYQLYFLKQGLRFQTRFPQIKRKPPRAVVQAPEAIPVKYWKRKHIVLAHQQRFDHAMHRQCPESFSMMTNKKRRRKLTKLNK